MESWMQLELVHARGSCALAALIALEAAGADYVATAIDLAGGQQRSPEFLALNPLGRVPVLLVGGQPVTELVAVLSYVAQQFPAAGLLPRDPLAAAQCYERLGWFSTSFHIAVAQLARGERFSPDPEVQERLKAPARARLQAYAEELDTSLAGPSLPDDQLTLADTLHPVMWRWAERFELELDRLDHWRRRVDAVRQQPAVTRALAVEAGTAAPGLAAA